MKTTFDKAFDYTMKWEGGFINDIHDPGGATNMGISLRFLKGLNIIEPYDYDNDGDVDAEDIKHMTPENAKSVYLQHFWRDEMAELAQSKEATDLVIKWFDFGVNMGMVQALKLIQTTINKITERPNKIAMDGIFGPKTHKRLIDILDDGYTYQFLNLYQGTTAKFYFNLADRRDTSRKFLYGWLRRCYDLP